MSNKYFFFFKFFLNNVFFCPACSAWFIVSLMLKFYDPKKKYAQRSNDVLFWTLNSNPKDSKFYYTKIDKNS